MRKTSRLTWLLIILFQAITRLKPIWTLVLEFWHCGSCAKHGDSASVSVARVMWMYKGDVNSGSGENWKEPTSSTISAEVLFNGDSNKETLNGVVLIHDTRSNDSRSNDAQFTRKLYISLHAHKELGGLIDLLNLKHHSP